MNERYMSEIYSASMTNYVVICLAIVVVINNTFQTDEVYGRKVNLTHNLLWRFFVLNASTAEQLMLTKRSLLLFNRTIN